MRVKQKDPKVSRVRRLVLSAAGIVAVVAALLAGNDSGDFEDLDAAGTAVETPAPTAVPEGYADTGELEWEYPEGWVDYSDLPERDSLGDSSMPGLANWRYTLVNGKDRTNYLREGFIPDMEEVEHGYYFRKVARDSLKEFLNAARAQGYVVSMSRTYMSYIDQKTRFNGLASTMKDRDGCTLEEAEQHYIEQGYYPGCDEHQTGLAVNVVDENAEAKFSTPVLVWMREHCAEYGFILRFPEGKEDITGRDAEPGHFRYVGEVAAEYIMRKGITLEEFKAAYTESEEEVDTTWKW